MQYRVLWKKDGNVVGSTPFDDKEAAIRHAAGMLPARKTALDVDLVEVLDEHGETVFVQTA